MWRYVLKVIQSSIGVAFWIVVDDMDENFDHRRKAYGYVLTYVDDFLIIRAANVRKAIEEEISRTWKSKVPETLFSLISRTPTRR